MAVDGELDLALELGHPAFGDAGMAALDVGARRFHASGVGRPARLQEDVGALDAALLDEMLDREFGIAAIVEGGDDSPLHEALRPVDACGLKAAGAIEVARPLPAIHFPKS